MRIFNIKALGLEEMSGWILLYWQCTWYIFQVIFFWWRVNGESVKGRRCVDLHFRKYFFFKTVIPSSRFNINSFPKVYISKAHKMWSKQSFCWRRYHLLKQNVDVRQIFIPALWSLENRLRSDILHPMEPALCNFHS